MREWRKTLWRSQSDDFDQAIDLSTVDVIETDLFYLRVAHTVYKSPSGTCMHLGDYAGSKSPRLESTWGIAWNKLTHEVQLSRSSNITGITEIRSDWG